MTPSADRPAESRSTVSDGRSVVVLLSLSLVPWSVQVYPAGAPTLVFAWGLVNLDPVGLTHILDFLRFSVGLPDYILAWVVGAGLYLLAVTSSLVGWRLGREDVRVTAGLLVLAGVAQLSLARGFSIQPNRLAVPLGTALLWAVAYWRYWPLIRARRA